MLQTLLELWNRLLGRRRPAPRRRQATTARRTSTTGGSTQPDSASAKKPPKFQDLPGRQRAALLDGSACTSARLREEEHQLLDEIEERINAGRFNLPQLPTNNARIMLLVNNPRTEIGELTKAIQMDPVLSGQLVRTANSVMYAGHEPVRSIQAGVMRIGTRAVRTLVLSASMKGILLKGKGVASYGKNVWRQSLSVSRIAWSIGPMVGYEQDAAFLLGMLHDVGKLPLLAMLDEASRKGRPVSRALIGKVFQRFHERVGSELAARWKMGEELVSVIGCHHRFAENEDYPKSAALVSLAHRLDLYQSLRDERGFDALVKCTEMDVLEVPEERRREILDMARAAYGSPDASESRRAA